MLFLGSSYEGQEASSKTVLLAIRYTVLLICLPLASTSLAVAHGGVTDSLGCHHDSQRGGYHCHSGPLAGQSFSSQEEALRALEVSTGESSSALSPVPYDRDLYGGWTDEDGDCQNTRQEVLIAESIGPVELDSRGCRVVSGQWLDPYTGETFTDPRDLYIDHLIPLAEAHRSGASRWSAKLRNEYANDLSYPRMLTAISSFANRSKRDRSPADWLPPNPDFHCGYVRAWIIAKNDWRLTMDNREREAVDSVLAQCEQPVMGLAR